jgi:L-lactate dehydrogenase complex protein LldF
MRLGRHVRGITPAWQGGWTAHRTPMRLAARGLRERMAERPPGG